MNTLDMVSNTYSVAVNVKPVITVNSHIQVFVVTSLDALEPYAEQWDQIALQAPQQLPMLSAAWVMAYLEHCLGSQESWKCYLAIEPHGRLVGVLPIIKTPHPLWRSFLPILHTPWDWHTRSGDLLANPGMEREVFQAFLKALREEFGSCFILEMRGVRDGSPTVALLSGDIPGWLSWIKQEPPGGFISVDGSFESFQEKFTDKVNRNLHRQGKRLTEMPGYTLTFFRGPWTNFSNLEKFFELEASGWKGKNGTAIACSLALKNFYRQLAHNLANRDWLELHLLEVEGKPIASHFAVRFGFALVIPKLAYDEAYSKFSSGSVLFEKAVKRAFEEKNCLEINLLSDANWLHRWKVEWGEYWQVYIFPRHPVPMLLGKVPKIVRAKLGRIQWIRRLYQRLSNVRKGLGENQSL